MRRALARILVASVLVIASGCSCEREPDFGRSHAAASAPARGADAPRVLGMTPDERARVVARVGTEAITLEDVAWEIAAQPEAAQLRFARPENRAAMLEELLRRRLLAVEARRRGLDLDPRVIRARRTALAQALAALWRTDPTVVVPPTDAEIRDYYETHRAEFATPARRRVRYILTTDEASARSALARLIERPTDDTLFRTISASISPEGPMQDASGETPFFSRVVDRRAGDPVVPSALVEAAFAAEMGAWISAPVSTPDGFYVARVIGEEPANAPTLDDVRGAITEILERDAVDRAVRRLVAERGDELRIDESALAAVRAPGADG